MMAQSDDPIQPLDDRTYLIGVTKPDNTPFGPRSNVMDILQEKLHKQKQWAQHSSKRPMSADIIPGCSCLEMKFRSLPWVRLGCYGHAIPLLSCRQTCLKPCQALRMACSSLYENRTIDKLGLTG